MKKIFLVLFGIMSSFSSFASDKIENVLYYFHGNFRCPTCHKLETYTQNVYEEYFKDKLSFKVINTDVASNQHYLTDYSLYSKSVILSKLKNGKETNFKNLDKIWEYVGDETKFKEYEKTEIEKFIK